MWTEGYRRKGKASLEGVSLQGSERPRRKDEIDSLWFDQRTTTKSNSNGSRRRKKGRSERIEGKSKKLVVG